MPDIQGQQPELTPEQIEALKQLEGMVGTLGKSFRKMREGCQASLKASREALEFASAKLAEVESLQQQLEAKRDTPEYAYVADSLTIMSRMFDGSKRMLEIQIAYDERNLAMAEQGLEMHQAAGQDPNAWVRLNESGLMADAYKFALPLEDVRYMEARAQMNLYLALHHWVACVDGIDVILRVAVNDQAVSPQDEAEEAGRAKMAEALKAAMQGNRDMAILVGQLGQELHDGWALFQWASKTLKSLANLPVDAKRQLLTDADWRRLNGKALTLATMIDRVQPFPELAQFFPEPQAPEVPFDQLEWLETGVPQTSNFGTGRLGTGRLQGSGQLPGTGGLGTGRLSTKPQR